MSRPRRGGSSRPSVTVEIAGEKHVLRSDLPPERTRAIAAHVDEVIRGQPGFGTLESSRAATLAALSITAELFRAREELERMREDADRRATELAAFLEAAHAGAERDSRALPPGGAGLRPAAGEP